MRSRGPPTEVDRHGGPRRRCSPGFARIPRNSSSAVESLDEKEALIAAQPKKFFTTSHYDGEPIVLARLAKVTKAEALDLIAESRRNRAAKTAVKAWDAAQG